MSSKIGKDKVHAMLSPSSASRWLVCTPSAVLESFEPDQTSTYAQEGTDAHTLAELKLAMKLGHISETEYNTRFDSFVLSSEYFNTEFEEYVDSYVDDVMYIVKDEYKDIETIVKLEQEVEFKDVVPDGHGTSDVVIIAKDFIHIVDLKFGKGVEVSAIDNPQLKLYALGSLYNFRLHGVYKEVRMTIIQPRLDNASTDTLSVNDLYDWANNVVKPKAEAAMKGEGELVPGDHCKFCKRRSKCEALGAMQLEIAQKQFEEVIVEDTVLEPKDMTPEMLARVMTIGPKFIDWFNAVKAYATATMINEDRKIPGYKVVEGRSQRVMLNPTAIADKLHTSGFPETDYLKPREILGITTLEKNIGKKLFNELCKEYIFKPAGRPTVVVESDRRPAIDSKQYKLTGQEFDEIETED